MTVVVHCGDDGDHRGSGLDVDRSRPQVGLWGPGYLSMDPIRFLNQFHGDDAAAAAALARLQPYYQQLSLCFVCFSKSLNEIDSCTIFFFLMLPLSLLMPFSVSQQACEESII
jgi:hypothetical protein